MKKGTKVVLTLAGVGVSIAALSALAGAREDGPPAAGGAGTWDGDGLMGGAVVDAFLSGDLPPGSVLLGGSNVACRTFAIGYLWSNGVDYGIVSDLRHLVDHLEEDIEGAECVIVAVSPSGDVRTFVSPPMTPEEMAEVLRPAAEFSGQAP